MSCKAVNSYSYDSAYTFEPFKSTKGITFGFQGDYYLEAAEIIDPDAPLAISRLCTAKKEGHGYQSRQRKRLASRQGDNAIGTHQEVELK